MILNSRASFKIFYLGLHYDEVNNLVYVTSKEKHWQGAVYGVSPSTLHVEATYTTDRMNHPTGLASYDGILYVAEQEAGQILMFNITTTKFIGKMATKVPGEVEQLLISPC